MVSRIGEIGTSKGEILLNFNGYSGQNKSETVTNYS